MAIFNPKYLNRKWTHSFEEDTENEMVYRPEGFVFVRSRGRMQFDLKENGEVVDTPIGRNDVPQSKAGAWKLQGDDLVINRSDGTGRVYHVKEVTPEKLVLKKDN
ncbi:hypothetical protein AAKU52_003509 [Pedobacter sp. CG_S7]|uniref:lipocalin family protein n=1 Tax=Pedobacter sp. CG_S7 TaxID=3143930 RepID=UPI0033998140